jgi:hypothetical protein
LEWDQALLFLEEGEEQYIEKHGPSVATLHHHPGLDDATFLSLVKPWLKKAKEECVPHHPADRVARFVRDLTGPREVIRKPYRGGELEKVTLRYGGDLWIEVRPEPEGSGISTSLGFFDHYIVVRSLSPDWRSVIASYLQEIKEEVLTSDPTDAQMEGIVEAARRTEEFEPVFKQFHDWSEVVGFRRQNDGQEIGLRYNLGHGRFGAWYPRQEQIILNVAKMREPHATLSPTFEDVSETEMQKLRVLETTLHELGHAKHGHRGSSSGHSYEQGYDWRHELQATDFVMQHAESELEGELFERWSLDNLKAKHNR